MRHFSICLAAALVSSSVSVMADEPKDGAVVSIEMLVADLTQVDKGAGDEDKAVIARIQELEKQGKLSRVTRLRLTTVNEQAAMAQFGERAAIATGRNIFGGRGAGGPGGGGEGSTSFTYQHVGTMAEFTPKVSGGQIAIDCKVEQSRLVPRKPALGATPPGDRQEAGVQPDSIETITARSIVQVKSGDTVLLTSRQQSSGDATTHTYILVTAKIAEAEEKRIDR